MAVKMKPNSAYFLHVNSFLYRRKLYLQRLHKNTIDYNNTVSLLSFHKMQPDYIYIVIKYIYIAFDNSNRYYLSFGYKVYESLDVLCSRREIEGCFSLECERNGRSGKSAVQVMRMSRLWRSGLS